MPSPDPVKGVKDAVEAEWATAHPLWLVTLHVDDDFMPVQGKPALLVADDGGPPIIGGPWLVRKVPSRITIRFTSFAVGRTESRTAVDDAVDFIRLHRPPVITRIESISSLLVTRDRATGAFLGSITMACLVRP